MTTTTQNADQSASMDRLRKIQMSYETVKAIAMLAVNTLASPSIEYLNENERLLIASALTRMIGELEAEF